MNKIRASQLPLRYCIKCNKELNWSEGEESTCKGCWDTQPQQVRVGPEVRKPIKFRPSELNYIEDLIDRNIEDGTYWGNKKQFIERQKNVKEKIIEMRKAL